jgi:hypothetical protein
MVSILGKWRKGLVAKSSHKEMSNIFIPFLNRHQLQLE